MTTIMDPNIHCVAVEGTFDDCQDIVKASFGDKEFREEVKLGAVNSINWARGEKITRVTTLEAVYDTRSSLITNSGDFRVLVITVLAQQTYYFWTYLRVTDDPSVPPGSLINFAVPTGNFGGEFFGMRIFVRVHYTLSILY